MGGRAAVVLVERAFAQPCPVYEFRSSDAPRQDFGPMRALAMADGGTGVDPTQSSLIAGAAAVIGAAIGGFCLWVANRLMGKAAFQSAINTGFSQLLERTEKLHAEERASWQAERLQLRGEIVNLKQTIISLKAALKREGVLDIPDDKYGSDALIELGPEDGDY